MLLDLDSVFLSVSWIAFCHCCYNELQCDDLSCVREQLLILVHNTGKSIGSERYIFYPHLNVSNCKDPTFRKRRSYTWLFNSKHCAWYYYNYRAYWIPFLWQGNRDQRVKRAPLEESWPAGLEKQPEFCKGMGFERENIHTCLKIMPSI